MKTQNYTDDTLILAKLFDALSNPARMQIVEMLSKRKTSTAGEISGSLPLCKSTVSEHFSQLKDAVLIQCNPSGSCLNYEINLDRLVEFRKLYSAFLNKLFRENEIPGCY